MPTTRGASEAVSGDLRVEVIAAYNLVVDSNGQQAPSAAYLGARYYNDGTTDLTNVFAYIGNHAANTPGIYPTRTPGAPFTGTLSLTHEGGSAGTADATRYLGTIPPGGFVTVYWLISYPQRDSSGTLLWGTSVKPDDDLWLAYDVWGTGKEDGITDREATVTRTLTFRNEISAAANKIEPNSANKVPIEYQDLFAEYVPSWGSQADNGSPGTKIVARGVWYDLGNVGEGFDNDGDLVPDHNVWMQPVGDPTSFDPSAFRLVRTTALLIVKLKSGGITVLQGDDQLYFDHVPENTGVVGWVGYEYLVRKDSGTFAISPYQEVASGKDNEKFNADYGTGPEVIATPSLNATLTKGATATVASGGNISYTVDFANTGTQPLGHPELEMPVIIQDSIPTGTVYLANSAATGNTLPSGVASYTILYSTTNGATWVATEPAAASVTDIQWWLSDALPAGQGGTVTFTVTASGTPTVIPNTAGLAFGPGDPALEADALTIVTGTNSISGTVFADTGAGVLYGDGVKDVTESPIDAITVSLYYDVNHDNLLDAGDILMSSVVTGGGTGYSFTSLADGDYLVVVDKTDGDLPAGSALTSKEVLATTLSASNATGLNFGFAPALSLVKELVGSSPVIEGALVSYTIDVGNRLPGDGTGLGSATNDLYSTSYAVARDSWTDPWDGTSGGHLPSSNPGDTILRGFELAGAGNIVGNDLILNVSLSGGVTSGNDILTVVVRNSSTGVTVSTTVRTVTQINALPGGSLVIPLDTIDRDGAGPAVPTAWEWTDFGAGNAWEVMLTIEKVTNTDGATIGVSSVHFRVEGDQFSGGATAAETLQPVPLTDAYNAAQLEYVSAEPTPTTVAPGALSWSDLGPIYPGGTKQVTVTFRALEPMVGTTHNAQNTATDNTATVAGAFFQDGSAANGATDTVTITVNPGGTIGDTIWRDANGDGTRDVGDNGIQGVTVYLYDDAGGTAGSWDGTDNLIATAVTDANGEFLFEGLTGTTYNVVVDTTSLPGSAGTSTKERDATLNDETNVTIAPLATDGTDTVLDADFGYDIGTLIDGYVWYDTDHGGQATQESNEPPLATVDVHLYDDANNNGIYDAGDGLVTNLLTTTDSNGYYAFAGNYSGNYVVVVDNATGDMTPGTWTPSYDTDTSLASANVVRLDGVVLGGTATADFSYYLSGSYSIGDTVFYDWDGSGAQDSPLDEGIADITVYLYQDIGTVGTYEPGTDILLAAHATDADGAYGFSNYPAGNYIVIVDQSDPDFPSGYKQTVDPDDGSQNGTAYDNQAAIAVSASRTDVDFGYTPIGTGSIGDTVFIDADGDGVQAGGAETGISGITVDLWIDFNGDLSYVLLASTVTDSNGNYLFENLPDGNYRVIVDTTDSDLPDDAFGSDYSPTTDTSVDITVSGGVGTIDSSGDSSLDADFGFAALASVGDSVYWDTNGNGTQDAGEPGVGGVTVYLYNDNNHNGVYDGGDTPASTPSVPTDADGNYVFTGLSAGDYVVVVNTASGPVQFAPPTADPDNDGLVCGDPDANEACNNQTGVTLALGRNFIGADFGYEPVSAIGDTIWFDLNQNGVRDVGELGIPFVTVTLTPSDGQDVGAGAGNPVTTTTDSDGYYSFANMADGTAVLTIDTVAVAALPGTPAASYERDGSTDGSVTILIASGAVTEIDGVSVTDADFELDFGYSYTGSNALSGTVGLDGATPDGVLGGTDVYTGVEADESAFANQTVYLYLLNEADGDGIYDVGETVTLITSTITDGNGDYSFTSLPVGDGNDSYIVSLAAPLDHLALATLAANTPDTPATSIVKTENLAGDTESAYQVVPIAASIQDMDFAFTLTLDYDFGDLPQTYSTKIGDTPDPAMHQVPGTVTLRLGASIDSESNGQPTADATGDGADEDGITPGTLWQDGVDGGSITYTVGLGSGWLVGWIDFDQSGDFTGPNEMVVSQAATAVQGATTVTFDVPASTINAGAATTLNARFRLFPSEPGIPEIMFAGEASNGEVEDYQWVVGSGTVEGTVYIDNNGNGLYDPGIDQPLAGVGITVTDVNSTVYNLTTDPLGHFSATVAAGDATVDVADSDLPDDGLPGADVALTTGSTDPTAVTVPAGGTATDNTGYVLAAGTGLVQGTLYIDVNGNGLYDSGDTPISGVEVKITDDTATTFTVITDANGHFQQVVSAGLTTVNVTESSLPVGATLTTNAHGQGSDPTVVTVPDGGAATDNTGYLSSTTGQVEGTIYDDHPTLGTQGLYDPGIDTPLGNVQVTITDDNGGVYTVTTDAVTGYFSQTVAAGDATVDVNDADIPAGYTLTDNTVTALGDGSDPTVVTVPSGGTGTDNTGYVDSTGNTGRVEGTVYIDNNANGTYDAGVDTPLPNVDVVITDANGGVYTVTTDENGYFSQTVAAGDADVDVDDLDLPAGVLPSPPGNDPTTVTVPVDDTATDNTGYVLPPGSGLVQGTLYIDNNGDGLFDSGDTPIANVSVLITDSAAATYTVTTDGNGYFQQIVSDGDTVVDIDQTDPDLPGGLSLTTNAHGQGTDPTTVTVPDGGAATDNTGTVYVSTPAFGVKTACSAPETGGILIAWSAQVELGVLKYLVQVADGDAWVTVGEVFARTEGLSGSSYEYLDRLAQPGEPRTYRLLCVDVDGKSRTHAVGEATAVALAPALAEVRSRAPVFPVNGVATVETLTYTVERYATETPAILGTARKATVAAGGLYGTGGAGRIYNLGQELPDLGGMVYIRPYTDPYTDANVVWGSTDALAIVGEPGTPPAPPAQGLLGPDGYTALVHVEKDETLALNSMLPPGPNWFYGFSSRLAPDNNPIITANVPSPAATGTATVRVAVRSTTSGAHDLGVSVNGKPVARATWTGQGYHLVQVTFDLASCPLVNGNNQIQLWTTAADSSKRLNYVEVVTPATPVLRDGSLVVDVLPGSTGSLDVPGLLHAVDITEFGNESLLSLRRGPIGGLYAGQKLYLTAAVGTLDWSAPKDLTAVDSALAGQQYVAVAPAAWLDVLPPLIAKHQAEGLASVAVSWEDVCDTYGGGLPTPAGLVRLGQRIQPRYLLLGAGASHDPKGLQGDLPPAGIATGFVHVYEGTASTDDLYTGGFSIAVGRLPARNRAELLNMVNKIVDFYPGRRAVMMADVDDATMAFGSFAQFQADLADDLPSLLFDANTMNGTAMRTALNAAINDGANLVTYQGHGNNALIGDEFDILNTSHVGQVPPSAWLMATCLTGVYTLETADTRVISSSLLRTPGNGAVSVLASTCYGQAGTEHLIVEAAVRRIAAGGATWGDVLLHIKRTLLPDETAAIYTLLGDPAMHTLNPVEGDREILIREPLAGGYVNGNQAPVVRFGLRGGWWRERLEISWRRDYGPWTPLGEITIDPAVFEYTVPWDLPPEDGGNYQVMIREIDADREGR